MPGEGPVPTPKPARRRTAQEPATDAEVRSWVTDALAGQQSWRAGESLALLRRAAEARPESAEILNHLGNALQDAGDQVQALDCYERAAAADPGFGPALQNLGYLLVNRGRTDEGVEFLRRADRVNPAPVNRVLIATALPVVYESEADLNDRRQQLEGDVAGLASDGLEIDTSTTLVPTSFFVAYQGQDDRSIHETLVAFTVVRTRPRTARSGAPEAQTAPGSDSSPPTFAITPSVVSTSAESRDSRPSASSGSSYRSAATATRWRHASRTRPTASWPYRETSPRREI